MDGVIVTLGSSTRQPEAFIALLHHYAIQALLDIRRFPTSQRYPHFSRDNLAPLVESAGIGYYYLGSELGGYRSGGYEAYMQTRQFAEGLERLEELAQGRRVALMCAERLPWRCHRRFVAEALRRRGWSVRHLIDIDREWVPREWQSEQQPELTPEGGRDGDL